MKYRYITVKEKKTLRTTPEGVALVEKQTKPSIDWKNLLERAAWSFLEGFLGALPISEFMGMNWAAIKAILFAALLAGLSSLKSLIIAIIEIRKYQLEKDDPRIEDDNEETQDNNEELSIDFDADSNEEDNR